jgi:hypothetical protein
MMGGLFCYLLGLGYMLVGSIVVGIGIGAEESFRSGDKGGFYTSLS